MPRSRKFSISKYKKKVWKFVSLAVRLRDADNKGKCTCISCNYKGYYIRDKIQAGHFLESRNFPGSRWDLDNIHGQCQKCNLGLNGNVYNYYLSLKEKIGQDRIDIFHKNSPKRIKETRRFLDAIKYEAFIIIWANSLKKNLWDWKTMFSNKDVKEIKEYCEQNNNNTKE